MTVLGTDKEIIEALIKDETFVQSIEYSEGKVKEIYADWEAGKVVYTFLSGRVSYLWFDDIIGFLKKNKYLEGQRTH